MSELEISLSLPLDSQGFLRRACPACCREFKWLSNEGDDTLPPPEQYYCPYCGASAALDEWFTPEQFAYIETEVVDQAILPSLEDLAKSVRKLNRSSGGLIKASAHIDLPGHRQAPPVFEPDDMRRVAFPCHPEEPIKIDETWGGPVHCLCCGRLSDAAS